MARKQPEPQEEKENRYDLIKRIAEKIQRGLFGDCDFDERYQDD